MGGAANFAIEWVKAVRIAAHYSHLNGLEYLLVHKPYLWDQIQKVIADVDAEACRTKISREKTMRGKTLYSPIDMNKAFEAQFANSEWKSSRTNYWVTEDARLIRKTMQMPPNDQKAEIEAAGFRMRAWDEETLRSASAGAADTALGIRELVMGDELAPILHAHQRNREEGRLVSVQAVFDRP